MTRFQLWRNYSRQEIAEVLGFQRKAIERGVFTPRGRKSIYLFVTRDKERSQTQYEDRILDDILMWEGERMHGNDQRIVNAADRRDKIYLFFRARHRQPFVYFGQIHLQTYELRSNQPSRFIFKIGKIKPFKLKTGNEDPGTERAATRKERVGQRKFREDVLTLWSDSCSVTLLHRPRLLRASHIRPWRHCSDKDRLNPYNGLALTPNLDSLFDIGLVSFKETDGSIRLSDVLDAQDWRVLNVKSKMSLHVVFPESREYLEYHNECVFEAWKKKAIDIFK